MDSAVSTNRSPLRSAAASAAARRSSSHLSPLPNRCVFFFLSFRFAALPAFYLSVPLGRAERCVYVFVELPVQCGRE